VASLAIANNLFSGLIPVPLSGTGVAVTRIASLSPPARHLRVSLVRPAQRRA
jgi:hypothetical protein